MLSRVIEGSASILAPLESITAGNQSSSPVVWSEALTTSFYHAQEALSSRKSIVIPKPEDLLLPTCHPTSQAATCHPVMTLVVRFAPSSLKLKTLWFAKFPSMTFSLALLLFLSPLVLHGYKPNKNVRTYAVPTLISSSVPVHQRNPSILKISSAISMLPLSLEMA
jgi:hypothetical protein